MQQVKPARLEKKQEKENIFEFLNQDILIRIKMYFLIVVAMALFLMFCFTIKGQTYGYL